MAKSRKTEQQTSPLERITLLVPKKLGDYFRYCAEQENMTINQAIRQLILKGLYLDKIVNQGNRVILERDGKQYILADEQFTIIPNNIERLIDLQQQNDFEEGGK